MANAIGLITKWSTKAWDKVYQAESCSSILDGDKELMKFTGAKTVKIAKFSSSGLSDYHRPNENVAGRHGGDGHDTDAAVGYGYGYQQGDAALVWEEFTINCDRAVQLRIELFDDEETDGLAVAAATTEVSRTKVVPEVDAYVFSKLAGLAGTVSTGTISLTAGLNGIGYQPNGPIQALNDAFQALADNEVPEVNQVIFCSNWFYNQLRSTGEILKTLRQTEYGDNVKFTIGEYEGRTIVAVPARRFRTGIVLGSNGYSFGANSQAIDFIVCAKDAVAHVVKYDKVKVFQPNVVQDFDGYKINIRVYHDLFVPDNKRPAIYAHIGGNAADAYTPVKLGFNYDSANGILSGVYTVPGNTLLDGLFLAPESVSLDVGDSIYSSGSTLVSGLVRVTPYVETGVKDIEGGSSTTVDYRLIGSLDGRVVAVSGETIGIMMSDE